MDDSLAYSFVFFCLIDIWIVDFVDLVKYY